MAIFIAGQNTQTPYRKVRLVYLLSSGYWERVAGIQQSLARQRRRTGEPEQLVLWKPRGGKRRGAGRPPKGKRAGAPHKERPALNARYPVHVVLRVVAAVGNLRRRCVYQAIREATITTARRESS